MRPSSSRRPTSQCRRHCGASAKAASLSAPGSTWATSRTLRPTEILRASAGCGRSPTCRGGMATSSRGLRRRSRSAARVSSGIWNAPTRRCPVSAPVSSRAQPSSSSSVPVHHNAVLCARVAVARGHLALSPRPNRPLALHDPMDAFLAAGSPRCVTGSLLLGRVSLTSATAIPACDQAHGACPRAAMARRSDSEPDDLVEKKIGRSVSSSGVLQL
jgi:hypothetical protein